jgi:hypothetical protein
MNTKEKLDALYELKCAIEVSNMDKQALIDSILTPEIKQKIAEIESEFSEKNAVVNTKLSALEYEIKADVVSGGETVKGDYLMAVFTKGRVSWDTKSLDGYAAAHPEVAQFKKTGDPSVSIRTI